MMVVMIVVMIVVVIVSIFAVVVVPIAVTSTSVDGWQSRQDRGLNGPWNGGRYGNELNGRRDLVWDEGLASSRC